jgi:hypothetical protein
MPMTILDMPDDHFRNVLLVPEPVQQVNRSAYTRRRTVMSNPWHAFWRLESADHVPMPDAAAALPWEAFEAQLEGVKNHFRFPATSEAQHAGSVVATVVSSANAVTLVIGSLPASVTYLPAGSRLTVRLDDGGEQMIKLKAALTSNGGGQASASFFPPLRSAPDIGSLVETKEPWAVLTLPQDKPYLGIVIDAGGLRPGFSLAGCVEDW